MGSLLRKQDKLTEAEPFFRESLEKHRRILGDDHPNTLVSMNNMGSLLEAQGKVAEAELLYREALEKQRRTLGEDHPSTMASIVNMGVLLVKTRRHREAVVLLAPAEAAARRVFTGGNGSGLATFLKALGEAYAALATPQDFASAEAKLRDAHTILTMVRGPTHEKTREFAKTMVDLYEAWHAAEPGGGHEKQAAEWKARLGAEPAKEAPK
jgi:tetratricopeptide (TPR) repeat protein